MQRTTVTWLVVGGIGWVGLVALAVQLATTAATGVGFDLELLLEGGRSVAAGRTPYDPAMLSGSSPGSTSLFYSYPPPLAQALAPFAGVPSAVMLGAWWLVAAAGAVAVGEGMRRRLAPERGVAATGIAVAAALPLVLPLAVGLLFGNYDAWFPLLYGAILLAGVAPGRATAVAGGLAIVAASLKLHPASMGLWFLVRGARATDRWAWRVAAVAVAGAVGVILVSLIVGGIGPWADYTLVVRAGAGADLVDPRNAGPAAVVAGILGGEEGTARVLQVVVSLAALGVTAWAAWTRDDPVESLAWAAAASLVTLPVTWYHYPSALIPFALAALLRVRGAATGRVRVLVLAAGLTAAAALVVLPLLWVAAGLVIAATRASRGGAPAAAARAAG